MRRSLREPQPRARDNLSFTCHYEPAFVFAPLDSYSHPIGKASLHDVQLFSIRVLHVLKHRAAMVDNRCNIGAGRAANSERLVHRSRIALEILFLSNGDHPIFFVQLFDAEHVVAFVRQ